MKTRPDADCGSDHELLTATVRIKMKNTNQVKKRLETEHRQYTRRIQKWNWTETSQNEPTTKKFGGNMEGHGEQAKNENGRSTGLK